MHCLLKGLSVPSAWRSYWTLHHLRQSSVAQASWQASLSRTSEKHLCLPRTERSPSENGTDIKMHFPSMNTASTVHLNAHNISKPNKQYCFPIQKLKMDGFSVIHHAPALALSNNSTYSISSACTYTYAITTY